MNRAAAALIVALTVLAVGYMAVQLGADVRERVLESRCLADGGEPLWQPSSPTDTRPDGFLAFHCEPRSHLTNPTP